MIERTPMFLLVTDPHIKEKNREQVVDLFDQAFQICQDAKLKEMYCAGDVFDSRKGQPQDNLLTWKKILDLADSYGIEIRGIAGNHDKRDYTSEESYLDVYQDHKAFTLVRDQGYFEVDQYTVIHMIPFFEEKSTYGSYLQSTIETVELLKQEKPDQRHLLVTHIGIDGVKNNDGSEVEGHIGTQAFKIFEQVYVGHYHDESKVGDNIHYIGSMAQANFGEDPKKGFTMVLGNLVTKKLISKAVTYETIKVDIDTIDPKELKTLMREHGGSTNKVKFKIEGSKEKIQALDKTDFDALGLQVQCEYKDIEIDMSFDQAENFQGFDSKEILEEWAIFADNEQLSVEQGESLLKQAMSHANS